MAPPSAKLTFVDFRFHGCLGNRDAMPPCDSARRA
ncbi:MAG: hypothetical protein ACI9U2_003926 [Bradymonadia bacterium]